RALALPAESPGVLSWRGLSLTLLASLQFVVRGNLSEAERLFKQALDLQTRLRGPDYPDVAICLSNLGWVYHDQGRFAEAEPLLEQAVAHCRKATTPNPLATANALRNLARHYTTHHRNREAELLLREALTVLEVHFGATSPVLASILKNLGHL